MSNSNFKTFLFEYSHDGGTWQLEVPAVDMNDARAKVRNFSQAKPVGELVARIPSQAGMLVKALCAVKNFFR